MRTARGTSTGSRLKREQPEAKAQRAAVALDNSEVREAFDIRREQIVLDMERLKLDGSTNAAAEAVELVRQLQTLLAVKRVIVAPVAVDIVKRARRSKQNSKHVVN